MASNEVPGDRPLGRRALRRAAFLTSDAGIAFGLLAITAWLLLADARLGTVDGSDPRELYSTDGVSAFELAALYLLPFAAIFFLWFIVALRAWIRSTQQRRNLLISDVQLVLGVIFTALFLVGAGALAASAVAAQTEPDVLGPETLRALNAFGNTIVQVMGVRIAAIFVIATASLGMTTSALPRWFNAASYVFAIVLMLTPIVSSALIIAFPAWVIALSVLLMYHVFTLPDDRLPGFARKVAAQSSVDDASAGDATSGSS